MPVKATFNLDTVKLAKYNFDTKLVMIQRRLLKTKLRGFSPRANHTDRAAAAGRRS